MAVYSRGSNLPVTQTTQAPQLMNKDLGSIIVKSLETVTESLDRDSVPIDYNTLEKGVTKGINKSDLVKKGMGGQVAAGGKADEALAGKYEQDKYIKWQEYQKKLQKEEQNARKEKLRQEEENWNKIQNNVNEKFSAIVGGIENPLKGISNLLDKSVKGFATGFTAGLKDVKDKKSQKEDVVQAKIASDSVVDKFDKNLDDIEDLIKDGDSEIVQNVEQSGDISDEMKDLISDDGKENKQDRDKRVQKEDTDEKEEKKKRGIIENVGFGVGKIVGTIGPMMAKIALFGILASQIFIFLKGQLARFLAESPIKRDMMFAKIHAALSVVPDKIKLVLQNIFSRIHFPGFSFDGSLTKKEKEEYQALSDKKVLQEESVKDLSKYGDKYGVDSSQFDLTTTEGQQEYQQAVISNMKSAGLSDKKIGKIAGKMSEKAAYIQQFTLTPEEEGRLAELEAVKGESYDEAKARLDDKQQALTEQYFEQNVMKRAQAGTLTEFRYNQAKNMGLNDAQFREKYAATRPEGASQDLAFHAESKSEAYLKTYEKWEQAWKDLARKPMQDIGIKVNIDQKQKNTNPLTK